MRSRILSGKKPLLPQYLHIQKHRKCIPINPVHTFPAPTRCKTRTPSLYQSHASLVPNPRKVIVDPEFVPTTIEISASHACPATHQKYQETPQLPFVTDPDFETILSSKLKLCNEIFDFSNPKNDIDSKELKEKYLCEIIDLFNNDCEAILLNSKFQRAIFLTVQYNIFRQDPVFPTKEQTFDFTVTVTEPSWPHLFYCYQIFNKFLILYPDAEFVNIGVAKRVIHLMQLPDINERTQLAIFMKTFYDIRPKDRKMIIQYLNGQLQSLHESVSVPYCAMPIMVLLTHIISRTPPPLPDDILKLINESLIPTLSIPYLPLFIISIKQFFLTLITSHPSNVVSILRHVEKFWPLTNASKQQQFLELLIFIFSHMPKDLFRPIARTSFAFLSQFVNSENVKLSDMVLDAWIKPPVEDWILQHSRIGIAEMFEAVNTASQNHWNRGTMEKANLVLAEMAKINKTQYHKMKMAQKQQDDKFSQNTKKSKPPSTPPLLPVVKKWSYMARKAFRRGYEIDVDETIAQITDYFSEEQNNHRITHFTPAVFEKMPRLNQIPTF